MGLGAVANARADTRIGRRARLQWEYPLSYSAGPVLALDLLRWSESRLYGSEVVYEGRRRELPHPRVTCSAMRTEHTCYTWLH